MAATSRVGVSSTTTPEKPLHRASTELESSNERKKRRFSLSSFHRSSRSRSRPNSILLPSSTSHFSTTPKGTPPREVTRILGEDGSRPHSYHAPDSWNLPPGTQLAATGHLQYTPPREGLQPQQSRLGILPSPAKSAFSTQERDTGQDVPPVPALPDTVRLSNDLSHEVLQSVIRYSATPVPAAKDRQAMAASPLLPQTSSARSDETHHPADRNLADQRIEETEVPPSLEHAVLLTGDAYIDRFDDGTTPPHIDYGQWPLTSETQPGQHPPLDSESSVPVETDPESPAEQARSASDSAYQQTAPDTIKPMPLDDDDDDRPPQLSYDPIPPSTDSDFARSLPSYLVPTHLDVSDDEDYKEDRTMRSKKRRFIRQAPRPDAAKAISPLLPPTNLPMSDIPGDAGIQTPTQTEYGDRSHEAEATGGHFMPQSDTSNLERIGAGDAANRLNVEVPTLTSETTVTSNVRAADHDDLASPGQLVSPSSSNTTSLDPSQARDAKRHPGWEAESIGASESSRASSQAREDDDSTSKVASRDQASSPTPVWFTKGDLQLPKSRAQGIVGPKIAASQHMSRNLESGPSAPRAEAQAVLGKAGAADRSHEPAPSRVPFHLEIVYAQEYAASDSSLTSWDRDSNTANSVSGTSQPGDMRDESSLVTPVAQVPRIVQHGQPGKAEDVNDNARNSGTPNGYFPSHDVHPHAIRHQQQQSSDLTVPERSKSMLSMISSMVSEGGTPISPTSSNAGRSTPSTIRRMQRDSSVSNQFKPAQIPEESMAMNEDLTPTATDDDFDLYADHNGVVKDLRDEHGQPLRVTQTPVPDSRAYPQSAKPGVPAGAVEARGEDGPRYSTERPMSFISGPADQDGRPQDQVNQPLKQGNSAAPSTAEENHSQARQPEAASRGPAYSGTDTAQNIQRAGIAESQRINPERNSPAPPSSTHNNSFRDITPVSQSTSRSVVPESSLLNQHTPPPSSFAPLSAMNGRPSNSGPNVGYGAQDPRMLGINPGQRSFQGHMPLPDRDPRFPGQTGGPSPTGPRNEYEFQQQMMQNQTVYPRPQGPNGQVPHAGPQPPVQNPPKPQEKSSSKPKFTSVFKGLGGKLQGTAQQTPHPPSSATRPHASASPMDANRNGSYTSGVSSLHRDQLAGRPGEQPGSSGPSNRPPSNGAESHFSHVSQNSTRVEPTDSRLDLRKPASPAPYQGIPPQQIPQRASIQGAQPQSYRAPTSGAPETGKKKRFSALGNIFGRSSEGPKLTKEAKKAQKAQRHSAAPQMQASQPQWPSQQPQFRPQQPGMPYPPGQVPSGQYPPAQLPPSHYPPSQMPTRQYPQGQFSPRQYPPGQYPPQQMRPMGPQFASSQTMSPGTPQSAQSMDPYGHPQHYQQMQPRPSALQQTPGANTEQGSAYLRTRQLAEEHQAQKALAPTGPTSRPSTHASGTSLEQSPAQSRQTSYGPPPGGYYNPNPTLSVPEKGAYQISQAARLLAEQQRQQPTAEQTSYGTTQVGRQQLQYQQHSALDEEAYRALQAERIRLEQQRMQLESEQGRYQSTQASTDSQRQESVVPPKPVYGNPDVGRQQPLGQQPPSVPAARQSTPPQKAAPGPSRDELLRAHQERQQREQELRSQQYADRVQPVVNHRSVSQPLPMQNAPPQPVVQQRIVSSPVEPQYETPQIPAAYNHVSGAFISPRDREQQPLHSASQALLARPSNDDRHYSDPRMPSLSPQVSAQSQMPPNNRTHSDASTVSVVSPISAPAPDLPSAAPPVAQRAQKPRMSSISEIHQGTPERAWHLNFPEGATEQEIVRARQRQFMQERFTDQQQQHAERAAQSPSPRASSHSHSPAALPLQTAVPQQQGGGFKELLPRSSPQPYPQSQPAPLPQAEGQIRHVDDLPTAQPAPMHPGQAAQPAAYPLPMSPDSAKAKSPINPLASVLPAPPLPPPKLAHSPIYPGAAQSQSATPQGQQHAPRTREQYEPSPPQGNQYAPPPGQTERYDQQEPEDPPPSYDGPGVPNDGMDKTRPEQSRPPNITTGADIDDSRDRQGDSRPRQPSLGILQHPQPASMAASPQRSSADMGAESLRRQLLQQEEVARMQRIQIAQVQRAETERERQEREAARARARELERSVSGGARVGSIRSVAGIRNGGQPGWERRGSNSRQVFELPAVEDDEPSMRATSYPGQEWVPPVWTDD